MHFSLTHIYDALLCLILSSSSSYSIHLLIPLAILFIHVFVYFKYIVRVFYIPRLVLLCHRSRISHWVHIGWIISFLTSTLHSAKARASSILRPSLSLYILHWFCLVPLIYLKIIFYRKIYSIHNSTSLFVVHFCSPSFSIFPYPFISPLIYSLPHSTIASFVKDGKEMRIFYHKHCHPILLHNTIAPLPFLLPSNSTFSHFLLLSASTLQQQSFEPEKSAGWFIPLLLLFNYRKRETGLNRWTFLTTYNNPRVEIEIEAHIQVVVVDIAVCFAWERATATAKKDFFLTIVSVETFLVVAAHSL